MIYLELCKNATDNSKNNFKGYDICLDERSEFGHTITEGGFTHTTDARNVLIFGADMRFRLETTSESEKTGLYGKIYDFVVDYEQISGVKAIYDMHRYLMTKHNIIP